MPPHGSLRHRLTPPHASMALALQTPFSSGVAVERRRHGELVIWIVGQENVMRTITPPEHTEGPVARAIEQQTARLPSDTFLWMAGGSIAASLTLKMMGRSHDALFVGQWAPTFLILGLYNKLVKLAGSDND
jgi:hypothetical protein